MRTAFIILLLIIGVTFTSPIATAQDEQSFPLKKGASWHYRGTFTTSRYKVDSQGERISNKVQKLKKRYVQAQMEVLDVVEIGDITAALIKGHPAQIFRQIDIAEPKDTSLLVRWGQRYYEFWDEEALTMWQRLQANESETSLKAALMEQDMVVSLPLYQGKIFSEGEDETKDAQISCWHWVVEKAQAVNLLSVTNLDHNRTYTEYQLHYSSNNGDSFSRFVPSLGFTGFKLIYHGPSLYQALKMQLVEVHNQ